MSRSTRYADRFDGYFLEDTECQFCLHYQGEKKDCKLEQCCCGTEKIEAIANGHIEREKGSMKWDG